MKYEDVEKAAALKSVISKLYDLKYDIDDIISKTELLDNRDFDSVFAKIETLINKYMKKIEDL